MEAFAFIAQHFSQGAITLRMRLARDLARRLKALPESARARELCLALRQAQFPELFAVPVDEARLTWRGVEALAEAGLVALQFNPRQDIHAEPWHREPKLVVQPGALQGLAHLGEVSLRSTFPDELTKELSGLGIEPEAARFIATRAPGILSGRGAKAAAEAVMSLRRLAATSPQLFLREVSARVFQARSKILDGREDWVSLVLDGTPCPWPAAPIQLQVSFPCEEPAQLLLIENLTTFESLRRGRGALLGPVILVYAAGFKAAAERVTTGHAQLYFDSLPDPQWASRLSAWFDGSGAESLPLPAAFFGDLDFAGMGILKVLRTRLPAVQAWQPGYAALAQMLGAGSGHRPTEADKSEQRDAGATGCAYADTVLLPLLREVERFVDQELFVLP